LRSLQEIQPDFVEEAKVLSWAVEPRKDRKTCIYTNELELKHSSYPDPLIHSGLLM
jgi:hypothetical protein